MHEYKKYNLEVNHKTISASLFTYPSRGLKIEGYLIQEKGISTKQPVIFYLRGGVGNFGAVSERVIDSKLSYYASCGYTVVGTNYINHLSDNEFTDEIGGEENKDLYALLGLLSENPMCDIDNIIFIGSSRAGINAFQNMNTFPGLKAISLGAAVYDLQEAFIFRKGLQKKYHGFFNTLISENLDKRNVSHYLPPKKGIHFFLQHGKDDDKVSVLQTIKFAEMLDKNDTSYVLDIKDEEGHSYHPQDAIVSWLDNLFK